VSRAAAGGSWAAISRTSPDQRRFLGLIRCGSLYRPRSPPARADGPSDRAGTPPSLTALAASCDKRSAETAYAASDFFDEEELSGFFESDDEDFEEVSAFAESFFDSPFSPPSLPERSSSRLRRLVP
jgi:hypothetical protein